MSSKIGETDDGSANADVLDRVASLSAFAGVDGNVLYLTRETSNRRGARWISRNAYATRIFGAAVVAYNVVGHSRAQAAFEMPARMLPSQLSSLS